MNTEEKQRFTTFDSASVFALMGGAIVLIASIVSDATSDQKAVQARSGAEKIAVQILSGGLKNIEIEKKIDGLARAPSQTKDELEAQGHIGLDPWNHPYHYRLLQDLDGKRIAIVISMGPNQKLDTDTQLFKSTDGQLKDVIFQGDDIGVVLHW